MDFSTTDLYPKALKARHLYNLGLIEREEMKEDVQPYVDKFNHRSKEIAKKFDVKPKYISVQSFLRF